MRQINRLPYSRNAYKTAKNFAVIKYQNAFVVVNYPLVISLFINRLQIIIFAECG